MWGGAAKMSYDPRNTPDYVKNILGPMRRHYINDRRAQMELLSSNVKDRNFTLIFNVDF